MDSFLQLSLWLKLLTATGLGSQLRFSSKNAAASKKLAASLTREPCGKLIALTFGFYQINACAATDLSIKALLFVGSAVWSLCCVSGNPEILRCNCYC